MAIENLNEEDDKEDDEEIPKKKKGSDKPKVWDLIKAQCNLAIPKAHEDLDMEVSVTWL